MGYHEAAATTNSPLFLQQLRRTAFSRIYSADKNLAIFLGRPPRLSKRFCWQQEIPDIRETGADLSGWEQYPEADYTVDSRWSAICASLKEEILELFYSKNRADLAPKSR